MRLPVFAAPASVFALCVAASTASGVRTQFIVLTPPAGATATYVYGTDGVHQAGCATIGGVAHACVWTGTAASFVDLHPAQYVNSCALGVDGAWQVGYVTLPTTPPQTAPIQAAVWNGTGDTGFVLPGSGTRTFANDISGDVIVGIDEHSSQGRWFYGGTSWRRTNSGWVTANLAAGASYSILGSRVAGFGTRFVGGGSWRYDAATRDGDSPPIFLLNPQNWDSYALGVSATSLVGYYLPSWVDHAMLWHDPDPAGIDLHPAAALSSRARAASDTRQVGYARFSETDVRACMWQGTAASYIEVKAWLQQRFFLMTGWTMTAATDISPDGRTIVGNGVLNGVPTAWMIRESCPADLDNDGSFQNGSAPDEAVTLDDLLYMLAGFESGSSLVDIDDGSGTGRRDFRVNIDDLLYFLRHFEQGC